VSKQQDQGDKIFGQTLPGTGGDLEPATDQDVEGHRAKSDGPTSFSPDAPRPGEGVRSRLDDSDEQDVEGHLYRTGPTTDGE
jgi:hypothetical protein